MAIVPGESDAEGDVAGVALLDLGEDVAHLGADERRALGGDRLVDRRAGVEGVLLGRVGALHGDADVAEELRRTVAETSFPHAHTQPGGRLTISVGIATSLDDANLMFAKSNLYKLFSDYKHQIF